MPGSSNFKQFDNTATNVADDTTYGASSQLASGFSAGIVPSAIFNKVMYQATTMAAGLGNVMANAGLTVTDASLSGLQTALINMFGTLGTLTSKSAAYTALQADHGVVFEYTGTNTFSLTAAATLGSGWFCWVINAGTGYITIDPNSSETCDGYSLQYLGPGNRCLLYCDGSGFYTFGRKPERIILEDQKTSGTNGGSSVSGSWLTRDLNTIVKDTTGQVTIGSNQFTLPPGDYDVSAKSYMQGCTQSRLKLYNVTDSTDAIVGISDYINNGTGIGTKLKAEGTLSLTATKTFEIRYRCNTALSTNGLGVAGSYGTEVYTHVELRRL